MAAQKSILRCPFAASSDFLVFCSQRLAFVFSKSGENDVVLDPQESITCVAVHPTGEFIATGGSDKTIKLWSTTDWSLLSSRTTEKLANSMVFVQKYPTINALVVADKFGDVTAFPLPDLEKNSKLLLGHLSIVTDMLSLENYLVTCDRDEKIRVSLIPRTFLVHSWCLGHKSVVTKLASPQFLPDVLISASADSTIRAWNINTGLELALFNMESVLGVFQQNENDESSEEKEKDEKDEKDERDERDEEKDEREEISRVGYMINHMVIHDDSRCIVTAIQDLPELFILSINHENEILAIELSSRISIPNNVLSLSTSDGIVWILTDKPSLLALTLNESNQLELFDSLPIQLRSIQVFNKYSSEEFIRKENSNHNELFKQKPKRHKKASQ